MIRIERATEAHTDLLAQMGRSTYAESHGHFIENENDLLEYLNKAFSISQTKKELIDRKNYFFLIYSDNTPVGYTKLVFGESHENLVSDKSCCLERIYVKNEYIPLKIGQKLLNHIEKQTKKLQCDTLWLSVYIKNERAIRFYEKNDFTKVGQRAFTVNGKNYENFVLSKSI